MRHAALFNDGGHRIGRRQLPSPSARFNYFSTLQPYMDNLGQSNSLDREFRLGLQKGHPLGTSAIRYNSHSRPIANDEWVVAFADPILRTTAVAPSVRKSTRISHDLILWNVVPHLQVLWVKRIVRRLVMNQFRSMPALRLNGRDPLCSQ